MLRLKKVGGVWFARVWRVQISFCLCRATPHKRAATQRRRYHGGNVLTLEPGEYASL